MDVYTVAMVSFLVLNDEYNRKIIKILWKNEQHKFRAYTYESVAFESKPLYGSKI